MRSSTKTDKTSEFTLLNVDSEVYLQSLPASKSDKCKMRSNVKSLTSNIVDEPFKYAKLS